jgi:hypothetical protein
VSETDQVIDALAHYLRGDQNEDTARVVSEFMISTALGIALRLDMLNANLQAINATLVCKRAV